MDNYLIALDLDGTLLQSDNTLSEFTIQTLQTLERMGHLIVIVTGRSYRISKHIYQKLGLNGPMVNCNGALCHHPKQADWQGYLKQAISLDAANHLITLQQQLNIGWIGIETETNVYTSTDQLPVSPYFPLPEQLYILTEQPLNTDPIAFGWFSSIDEQNTLKKYIQQYSPVPLDVRTWGGAFPCLDVTPKGVHKASAIKHLLDFYNMDTDHLIAFGDEHNDTEMLLLAKYGIAMKNAVSQIISITNNVTQFSNDEDGVAKYLASFFNLV